MEKTVNKITSLKMQRTSLNFADFCLVCLRVLCLLAFVLICIYMGLWVNEKSMTHGNVSTCCWNWTYPFFVLTKVEITMFSVNGAVCRNEPTKNCHLTLQSFFPLMNLLASVFWFNGLQRYYFDALSSTDESDSILSVEQIFIITTAHSASLSWA